MVVHVEIDPCRGNVSTSDTTNQTICHFKISEVFLEEDIPLMFKQIRRNVRGEFGFAAINFSSEYSYSLRKKFVRYGLRYGFKKVQLISWRSGILHSALFQSNYKPEDGDFILIAYQSLAFLWQNESDILKYIGFVSAIEDFDSDDFKDKFGKYPNVIFFNQYLTECNFKESFPYSLCFAYSSTWAIDNYGIIFKARTTLNDPNLNNFNVQLLFEQNMTLSVNGIKIGCIKSDEKLPLTKSLPFVTVDDVNVLEVAFSEDEKQYFSLPTFPRLLLMLSIDSNSIFSLKCADITDDNENEWKKYVTKSPNKCTPKINAIKIYTFPKKFQILEGQQQNTFGIDLGTSRCCGAVSRKSGIETLGLELTGGRLLHSYVGFDEEIPKCGKIVVDRLRNYANSAVFDAKRLIGKSVDEIKEDKSWPFKINKFHVIEPKINYKTENERDDNFLIKLKGYSGTVFKTPEEISSILLKFIKLKAEEFQEKEFFEAVITVPAAFNDTQKQATFDAGIMAGFKNVHLLPEPIAATFAYYVEKPIPNNTTLLLFDLGGGTLDVCIFKIQKNQLQIISSSGDPNVGGRDFDNLLVQHFEKILKQDFKMKMTEDKRLKLWQKCQSIKENLSVLNEDSLDVEDIDPGYDINNNNILITRKEFEQMSEELLLRIQYQIETALDMIEFEPNQINKVLQVGGGCKMPMIKNLLKEIFPTSEHCSANNPDEVVAIGAAYYSHFLNQKDAANCSII